MDIRDYETGRKLTDIDISLTREEAEELSVCLSRLVTDPSLRAVQLSRIEGVGIAAEVAFSLSPENG